MWKRYFYCAVSFCHLFSRGLQYYKQRCQKSICFHAVQASCWLTVLILGVTWVCYAGFVVQWLNHKQLKVWFLQFITVFENISFWWLLSFILKGNFSFFLKEKCCWGLILWDLYQVIHLTFHTRNFRSLTYFGVPLVRIRLSFFFDRPCLKTLADFSVSSSNLEILFPLV